MKNDTQNTQKKIANNNKARKALLESGKDSMAFHFCGQSFDLSEVATIEEDSFVEKGAKQYVAYHAKGFAWLIKVDANGIYQRKTVTGKKVVGSVELLGKAGYELMLLCEFEAQRQVKAEYTHDKKTFTGSLVVEGEKAFAILGKAGKSFYVKNVEAKANAYNKLVLGCKLSG